MPQLVQNGKTWLKCAKDNLKECQKKLLEEDWKPDYGERKIHPTAGVTAVGVRMPLVAFNINLDTDDLEIANKISKINSWIKRWIQIL